MKKIILSAIILLSFSSIFGQTEQGKIMIGATSSLGFSSFKFEDDDNATISFNISPEASYFLIDNLATGVIVRLNSSKDGDSKQSSFAVGPALRYYFLEGPIKPFINTRYIFGTNKQEFDGFELEADFSEFQVSGGGAFFINNSISLDAQLRYTTGSHKLDLRNAERQKYSAFGFDVGFNIYF